ncbi:MAG: hypothetical protein PVF45_11410 [Anaerolineae bacterium]|jgi:hypothetical protein
MNARVRKLRLVAAFIVGAVLLTVYWATAATSVAPPPAETGPSRLPTNPGAPLAYSLPEYNLSLSHR